MIYNKRFSNFLKKTSLTLGTLLLSIMLPAAIFTSFITPSASALSINGGQDCKANSVITCGVTSTQQLANFLPGHTAILDLYLKSFNITQQDISSINNTKDVANQNVTYVGSVDVNNDVIVNGRIVATNAVTAGRDSISNQYGGSTPAPYDGYPFYIRTPRVSFTVSSLPAFVVMRNGLFQYAIISSCGNPVRATAVPAPAPTPTPAVPTYTCDSLVISNYPYNSNNIIATVYHTQTNGAVYTNVTYQFKNDTNNTITWLTSGDTNVNYSSANSFGPQTVTATVNFTLNGKTVSASNPQNCVRSVTLPAQPTPQQPSYICTYLTLSQATSNPNTVVMNVGHDSANGPVYQNVTYKINNLTSGTSNTLTAGDTNVNYTFDSYGEQSITATVNFILNGQIVSATSPGCIKSVTIAQPSTPNYACTSITVSNDPNSANSIIATSTFTATGGAVFSGVSYDFGDNNVQVITDPSNLTVSHTYTIAGTYIVSATYTFTVGTTTQTVSSANCTKSVTFTPPPTAMCTIPGLAQYPANSPNCVVIVPASHLVNTGPGGVGTFAAILGAVSAIAGSAYYVVARYRNNKLL